MCGFLLQPNLIFGRAVRLLGGERRKKKKKGKKAGGRERREKRKKLSPLGSQMPIEDDTSVSRLKGLYDIHVGGSFWVWGWGFLICF